MSEQARDVPVDRVRRQTGARGMGHYIVNADGESFVENQIDYRHSVVQAHKRADADDETLEICAWCFCEVDVVPSPHQPGCEGIGKPRPAAVAPSTLQLVSQDEPVAVLAERESQAAPVSVDSPSRRSTREPASRSASTAGGSRPVWTPESVIEALQRWADAHGEPPKAEDWTKKIDGYPTQSTVINKFGSWSKAILAAGFEPRKRGGDLAPRAATRSEREPKAREAVSVLPVSPPDDLHVVDDTVGIGDVVSRSEDAALDVRTITEGDRDWAALVDAEAVRCLAEADRLTARAEALELVSKGIRMLKETDA